MLTIGPPGFFAFGAYLLIWGLFLRRIAYWLIGRNPDSPFGRAILFIY